MILPGRLIFKIENFKFVKMNMNSSLFILLFCNILIYFIQLIISQPSYSKLEKEWKYLESPIVLKSIQNLYLKSVDPLLVKQKTENLKMDPYAFLKDENFWLKAKNINYQTDHVQLAYAKEIVEKIQLESAKSKAGIFGLASKNNTLLNWLTYQFTHSHFFHLFSNMIFLFIAISLLKSSVSDFSILLMYVFSGFAAGSAYLLWSVDHVYPMIGASGSVAGLLAFAVVLKGTRPIEWTYFIPFKNGTGLFYLPAYYIFPMFLLSDFTELIKAPYGSTGNIALNAHVGGSLFGLIMAFILLAYLHIQKKVSTLTDVN